MNLLPLHLLAKFYHVIFISRVHFFRPVNGVFHPYFPMAYFSCLITLYFLWSETAPYLTGKGNNFLHCRLIWHFQTRCTTNTQVSMLSVLWKHLISFKQEYFSLVWKEIPQEIYLRAWECNNQICSKYNYSFKGQNIYYNKKISSVISKKISIDTNTKKD